MSETIGAYERLFRPLVGGRYAHALAQKRKGALIAAFSLVLLVLIWVVVAFTVPQFLDFSWFLILFAVLFLVLFGIAMFFAVRFSAIGFAMKRELLLGGINVKRAPALVRPSAFDYWLKHERLSVDQVLAVWQS